MRLHQLLLVAVSILFLPEEIFSMSPLQADVYDSSKEISRHGFIMTPDGLRRLGTTWDKNKLLNELNLGSVIKVKAIGVNGILQIRDTSALLNLLNQTAFSYDKIDFIYNTRLTKDEKEFILIQSICLTFIFGLIELRHPFHETNPKPYNWKFPFYGLAIGSALSLSLTFGHEKKRVYLTWEIR